MGIEIISFDVDGTLVDPDYNELIWQKAIPELLAKKEGISFDYALRKVQKEYDLLGDNNIKWYNIKYWIEYFELEVDYKKLLQKYEDRIKVYPEVKDILSILNDKYQLICISAMPIEFLEPKLKDLKKYFSSTFSTLTDFQELKNEKIYQKICQKLRVAPDIVLHIGDNEKTDYIAAKQAGLKSVLIDRNQLGYKKKYFNDVIDSLWGILKRIE